MSKFNNIFIIVLSLEKINKLRDFEISNVLHVMMDTNMIYIG
jgi:hypothetical protein